MDWKVILSDGREIAHCPTLAYAQLITRALNGKGHMPSDIRTHNPVLIEGLTAEIKRNFKTKDHGDAS